MQVQTQSEFSEDEPLSVVIMKVWVCSVVILLSEFISNLLTYAVWLLIHRMVEKLYVEPKVERCYYTLGVFSRIAGNLKFLWNTMIFLYRKCCLLIRFVISSDRFTALSPNPVNALLKVCFFYSVLLVLKVVITTEHEPSPSS